MGFASDLDGGVGRADGEVDDVEESAEHVEDNGGEVVDVDVPDALATCQQACLTWGMQCTHSA